MIKYDDYEIIKKSEDNEVQFKKLLRKYKINLNDLDKYKKYVEDVLKINTVIQSLGGIIVKQFNAYSQKHFYNYNYEIEEISIKNKDSFYMKIYDSPDSFDYFCDYREINVFKKIAKKNNKKMFFLFYLKGFIFLFDDKQIENFNYLINEKRYAYNQIDDILGDKYFIIPKEIRIISYYYKNDNGKRITDIYHGYLGKEEYYVDDEMVEDCNLDTGKTSLFLFFTGALREKGNEREIEKIENYDSIIETTIPKNTVIAYHEIFIDAVSHIEHFDADEISHWEKFYKDNSEEVINERYELAIKTTYIKLESMVFQFDGPKMNEIFDKSISPLIIDFLKMPQDIQENVDLKKAKGVRLAKIICSLMMALSFGLFLLYFFYNYNKEQFYPAFFNTEYFAAFLIIIAIISCFVFVVWRGLITFDLNKKIKENSNDTIFGSSLFDTIVNRFLKNYMIYLIVRNIVFAIMTISLGITIVSTQCNIYLLFAASFITIMLLWITIMTTVVQIVRQTIDYTEIVKFIRIRKKKEGSEDLYKQIDNYAKTYYYDYPVLKILSLTYRETTYRKQFKVFKKQMKKYLNEKYMVDIVE